MPNYPTSPGSKPQVSLLVFQSVGDERGGETVRYAEMLPRSPPAACLRRPSPGWLHCQVNSCLALRPEFHGTTRFFPTAHRGFQTVPAGRQFHRVEALPIGNHLHLKRIRQQRRDPYFPVFDPFTAIAPFYLSLYLPFSSIDLDQHQVPPRLRVGVPPEPKLVPPTAPGHPGKGLVTIHVFYDDVESQRHPGPQLPLSTRQPVYIYPPLVPAISRLEPHCRGNILLLPLGNNLWRAVYPTRIRAPRDILDHGRDLLPVPYVHEHLTPVLAEPNSLVRGVDYR